MNHSSAKRNLFPLFVAEILVLFGIVILRGDRDGQRGEHIGEQVHQQQLPGSHRRPPGPERRPDPSGTSAVATDAIKTSEGPRKRALGRSRGIPLMGELRAVPQMGDESVASGAVTSYVGDVLRPRACGAEGEL